MRRGRPAASCQERLEQFGARVLSDAELLTLLLSPTAGTNSVREAAAKLLDALPLSEIAWASADELQQQPGIGRARATAIAAAFELGKRGAWSPPRRGERILDPRRVYELLRHVAHAEREEFHTVLLDVRGRLIKTVKIAEGSLTQCPVSLRDAVRIGAHGVVFVHSVTRHRMHIDVTTAVMCSNRLEDLQRIAYAVAQCKRTRSSSHTMNTTVEIASIVHENDCVTPAS